MQEEPEIKLPTPAGSQEKQENSKNTSTLASLTTLEQLILWITTNWKILREIGIPDHLTYLLRNLNAEQEATVRTGREQQTGLKLRKEYIKAVYCHPACLTYMQSTWSKMVGLMRQTVESDCWKKYQ